MFFVYCAVEFCAVLYMLSTCVFSALHCVSCEDLCAVRFMCVLCDCDLCVCVGQVVCVVGCLSNECNL